MGPNHGTRKPSMFAPEDIISSMPDNVITNILYCLPLQDAVNTGILSRDWRYKWTSQTQLVFDSGFYAYLVESNRENYYGRIITRLLLHLQGAITKFELFIEERCYSILDAEDINNWIMFLSKKGLKEFRLTNLHETSFRLHSHFFYCLELKHLMLHNCIIHPMPSFRGFPNLSSLDLFQVTFEKYECGKFITQSPLLEMVKINYNCVTDDMEQAEIAELENLKMLSLPLSMLDDMITSSSILQLMRFFPRLQELTLDFYDCELSEDAIKTVLVSLPSIKTLILHDLYFSNSIMLSCASDLICCSPNLQTLKIVATKDEDEDEDDPPHTLCFSDLDLSRLGKLQLRQVVLEFIRGSENEICLIKYLLTSSPLLKKMVISANSSELFGGDNGERMFTTRLLELQRASPLAVININWL